MWRLRRVRTHLAALGAADPEPELEPHPDQTPPSGRQLRVGALTGSGFGAAVLGVDIAGLAAAAERSETVEAVRGALAAHQLLVLEGGASMEQIRAVHVCAHRALGCEPMIPPADSAGGGGVQALDRAANDSGNLDFATFPGFSESAVFGRSDAVDWGGLRGFVAPSSDLAGPRHQFHHDIAMGERAGPLPPVVSLYCAEAPKRGGGAIPLPTGGEIRYAAGSTLYASARRALELAPPALAKRARRMVCCNRNVFVTSAPGTPEEERYPKMAPSGCRPASPPSAADLQHAAQVRKEKLAADNDGNHLGGDEFDRSRVSLVQTGADGSSHLLVNTLELDHLEEGGVELSWEESMSFLEALMERGTQPEEILVHSWRPGQLCLWDNRSVWHSTTPQHAYTGLPEAEGRRLMARTLLPSPSWQPSMVAADA